MSSWLKNGRAAILEALAAACDQVDERARAEMEDRTLNNKQLIEELESLRSRVAQVDRLQQENESLQAEIGRLRELQDMLVVSSNKRTVLGQLSPNKSSAEQSVLSRKASHDVAAGSSASANFKAVVVKCKELDIKYKGACKLLEEHRLALRKRAKVIERWARHSDALQRKIDHLQAKPQSHSSSEDGVTIAQADEAGVLTSVDDEFVDTADLKRPSPESTFEHEPPSSPPPPFAVPGGNSALSPPHRHSSEQPFRLPAHDTLPRTASAATTESLLSTADDADLPSHVDQPVEADLAAAKVELLSDPPIIVSTRSVRKRKHGIGETDDARAQKVKLEHSSSSSPEIIRESHHYSPVESIDFDEEVHVPTPRKRRALQEKSGYDNTISTLGTITRPGLSLQRRVSPEECGALDQSHTPSHGNVGSKSHKFTAPWALSPQPKKIGRAAMTDGPLRPGVFTSNLALGVKDLAEDGDAEKGNAASDQIQRSVVQSRLDALLNSPSVHSRPLIGRDDPPRNQNPRPVPAHDGDDDTSFTTASKNRHDSRATPRDTKLSMPKQSVRSSLNPNPSVNRDRAPKTPSIIRDDMPRGRSLNKEDLPLRQRPIEMLRPEDFKPNPLYNDGLTFVYDEVVRGRDARAALSGCIDPNCCGKTFRRFAEAELKSAGSLVTRRAEDVGLMERYLGDEAFKLGLMTQEERDEAWLKAKTWELANKFGKHRQRYSRMPSPPGFWSMDFPNTQERAEELRQAEEIRKALVSERYREAMRCEGSWLFRDEESR